MSQRKEWITKRYGAIAEGGGCCCSAESTAAEIGYTTADLAAAPDGANLGLGCGNPIAIASIRPGETVLDLGSGAGFDAFLAAGRVGPQGRVIGLDMTPQMVERARANAAAGGHANVEFRLGDIEQMPVESDSVDLVISNCVLNLVPDKAAAFREIARVLRPGGRLAVADIVLDAPLPACLQDDKEAYCACIAGAVSREEYLAGLQAAGLADVQVVSEADAAALLASDCCGEGAALPAGVTTSIRVAGRKPVQEERA